jgi:hypothetical protein
MEFYLEVIQQDVYVAIRIRSDLILKKIQIDLILHDFFHKVNLIRLV